MPALLKGFLNRFCARLYDRNDTARRQLEDRAEGQVVADRYHHGHASLRLSLVFRAHSLRSLKRSILALVGIGPNRHTLIGQIEGMSDLRRRNHLETMHDLGKRAYLVPAPRTPPGA
jgi:putative NADPH-quinone reductase